MTDRQSFPVCPCFLRTGETGVQEKEAFCKMCNESAEKKRLLSMLAANLLLLTLIFTLAITGCRGRSVEADTDRTSSAAQGSPRLTVSHDSGIYDETTLSVRISAPEGFSVAYTTDGSAPTPADDSGRSQLKVTIRKQKDGGRLIQSRKIMSYETGSQLMQDKALPRGSILRAGLVSPSGEIFSEETRIYFLGKGFLDRFPSCLILSIYTDPQNLLDYNSGILATGAVFDRWAQTPEGKELILSHRYEFYQANFTQKGKAWERPCLIQIYDGERAPAAEENAGLRVRGGVSRNYSQKSFNIYFKDKYGKDRLSYELFDGIPRYKSFSLNAGGNNTEFLKYKESFLKSLIADRDLTILSSRTAVLFLNGEYWGPYTLSEKISDQTLHDHYGVDADQIVVIKDGAIEVGREGDIKLYEELASFAQKDFKDPEIYRQFCEIVNIRSFAEYCALRVYIGDADWKWEKNDVLWRTRDDSFQGGKWQFLPHDIEYSSGLYSMQDTDPETDHFHLSLQNYPLLNAALQNDAFYDLFLETIRDMGANDFSPARVEEALQYWDAKWEPLLPDYYRRYSVPPENWNNTRDGVVRFFRQRYEFLIPCIERWHDSDTLS